MKRDTLKDYLRLMVVTPDCESIPLSDLEATIRELVRGGVTSVMFREKRLCDDEFAAQARRLSDIAREDGAKLILNERIHLSETVEPDMLHLTWRSRIPANWVPALPVGRSVHSFDEAIQAEDAIDYFVYGPIYPTQSKEGLVDVQGLARLRQLCSRSDVPIVAIGGIDPSRAHACIQAGAQGVAALSGLCARSVAEYAAAVGEGASR